ncbi:homoserine kinase [Phycicoccus endophyticus]|uniref:Homoserine kinase n=1 Tax=Phycicoccus endophyticus TaxID=1690220 RepID=A0A7G9QYL7_9MICO|nr:homoserine kinase [Phycicoccus endophyticus]NHI19347.1 homoserine kinase [Phycicoccus endophyticus]QNN48442.1 homoserine kinase [Phycicoccus endophyticus]GGL42018.1 homoserine kinase [Phycicoccus endophyticus]
MGEVEAVLRPGAAVEVEVPASSANLGPGFDSVGCALGVWDRCRVTVTPEPGLVVTVEGEGAGAVPLDESHLVLRAMRAAWAEVGVDVPGGLRLECHNAVPHGRGMGSSATAIVTGIVAALGLASTAQGDPGVVDLDAASALAARLEGHPDNASASVYGGVTLSWTDPTGAASTVRLPVHADLEPVVFAPPSQLSTARARSVLPQQVRLADAAANSARAALLAYAVGAAPQHLLEATRDWLHQEARRGSYPESMALVDRLRAAGHAAAISGAGPSVLVLTPRPRVDAVRAHAPSGWRVLAPGIPEHGAVLRVLATG